jgi:hypothetical protein
MITGTRPLKKDSVTNLSPHNTNPAVSIQSFMKSLILAKLRLYIIETRVETALIMAAVEGVPIPSILRKMLMFEGRERKSIVTKKYVNAAVITGPEK